MAAEGFPVAHIDKYAKSCEPAIHVLRSVVRVPTESSHMLNCGVRSEYTRSSYHRVGHVVGS